MKICIEKKSVRFLSYSWYTLLSVLVINPLPNCRFLDSFKMKAFADDKTNETNENTMGKGEIACYKQFLFFPLCFQ